MHTMVKLRRLKNVFAGDLSCMTLKKIEQGSWCAIWTDSDRVVGLVRTSSSDGDPKRENQK
jgi:hypothetical protein